MLTKKRKRQFIPAVIFLIAAAGFFFYFTPRPVIVNPSDVKIGYVSYRGSDIGVFDERKLIFILSEYECIHTLKSYFPYDAGRFEIEIDGSASDKPMHLVIGENVSIVYESADSSVFEIIDKKQNFKNRILEAIGTDQ